MLCDTYLGIMLRGTLCDNTRYILPANLYRLKSRILITPAHLLNLRLHREHHVWAPFHQ